MLERTARILLVDDDHALLKLMQTFVTSRSHHHFQFESDPFQALGALSTRRFDLLITDQRMPGLTGQQLAACARDLQPGICVIVISGELPPFDERPFGADWFVTKPFYPPDLLGAVNAQLGYAGSVDVPVNRVASGSASRRPGASSDQT